MRLARQALIFLLMFSFHFTCNKNDDSGACGKFDARLQAPATPGPSFWILLSDEKGALLDARRAEAAGGYSVSTRECAGRYDFTIIQRREEEVAIGGNPATVAIYEATTFLDVADGLEFDRRDPGQGELRDFSIEGVQSLELLLWPEESLQSFGRDAFIDQAVQRLSFEIPVYEGDPAFLIIRANGEAENRFLWVNAVDRYSFTFDYGALDRLEPFGPIALPNDAPWRYFVDGVGEFGATRLDYSSLPDQVFFEFGTALPPADTVRAYRLTAREERFKNGGLFFPVYFEKELPGMPAAIPEPEVDFTLQRNSRESFQANVTEGQPTALALFLHDNASNAGQGPWLRWSVYGSPEAMADFRLPPWPAELSAARADLLAEGRQTPVIMRAFTYDSQPTYRQFLDARAAREEGWDAQQGLEAKEKSF